MIEEISPELFSWELYNGCGLWELDDAIYAADSFGYCDASRLRVRPKTGEYALMVTWHNGEKCWFHVDAKLLETIKRRLNRKAVQNEAHTI